MPEAAQILIIEDNHDLAFGLRTNLEVQGYDIELAENGRQGLALAMQESFDLIILDLMLPEIGGIDVLRQLRKKDRQTPVLILTAKGNEVDKVMGLRLGADDYVTKSFGLMELMARVEALLRRAAMRKRAKRCWGKGPTCTRRRMMAARTPAFISPTCTGWRSMRTRKGLWRLARGRRTKQPSPRPSLRSALGHRERRSAGQLTTGKRPRRISCCGPGRTPRQRTPKDTRRCMRPRCTGTSRW